GGERAARASSRARNRGGRVARFGARIHSESVRRPEAEGAGERRARRRAAGAREARARSVQIPARDRVRDGSAADGDWKDPPRRAPRARAAAEGSGRVALPYVRGVRLQADPRSATKTRKHESPWWIFFI